MKDRNRALVLVMIAAAVCVGIWAAVGLWVPVAVGSGGGREVRFTLHPREPVGTAAQRLRAAGLIRSARLFCAAAACGNRWQRAHAGDYALRPSLSTMDILRRFERGDVIAEWITIPEGLTIWQVAALVEARGLGSAQAFLEAAGSAPAFDPGFPVPGESLEGYLFPDTYRVGRGEGAPQALVRMMLARFEQVVWRDLLRGRGSAASLHEVVTLASLVEGEAKLDRERPLIAAVLRNRLQRGLKLECDATVQYALGPGNRKPRLTYADLETPSPYNTYKHAGLPPGPINSPGRASIAAALRPADVPYLFYVARPDGSHVFSVTLQEHQRAKARVRARS